MIVILTNYKRSIVICSSGMIVDTKTVIIETYATKILSIRYVLLSQAEFRFHNYYDSR